MLVQPFAADAGVFSTGLRMSDSPDTRGQGESVRSLLERVRRGDRSAAAQLTEVFGPQLRRRFRQRLGVSGWFGADSEDFFSTVLRRFDESVALGALTSKNGDQLVRELFALAESAATEYEARARIEQSARARALTSDRSESETPDDTAQQIGDDLMRTLSESDRAILRLRLAGHKHSVISAVLDLPKSVVRMRWSRLSARLRRSGEGGAA